MSTESPPRRRFSLPRPSTPRSTTVEEPEYTPVSAFRQRPKPLNSLTAAASLLSGTPQFDVSKAQGWQEDAWDMFDLVGEERFLGTTLANRCAQARLFVGKYPEDDTEDVVPVESGPAVDVFDAFGGGPSQRGQIIARQALSLFIAGDGSIIGIPPDVMATASADGGSIVPVNSLAQDSDLDVTDLEWRQFSVTELTQTGDELTIQITKRTKIKCRATDVYGMRVWRPHPRRYWDADSPTRSSLPVLRELVGLTMHISAQIDSRLAGAGILIVPETAKRSLAYDEPEGEDGSDPFTEALMDAMITPITDRSSASAVVPLVLTVPDESAQYFKHMTFATPLDKEARQMREEAIRRLALGQDAPPEILLGVGGMNHWGAWLVREDTITTHIEPPLALICDALTAQYLWPVLEQQGMSKEEAQQHVIWYDVSHMIMRPNKSTDAFSLYELDELSGASLRDATGFSDEDAPVEPIKDEATLAALQLAEANPSLIQNPGLPTLIDQYKTLYSGGTLELPPPPPEVVEPPDDAADEVKPDGEEEKPPNEPVSGPPKPTNSPLMK